MTVSLKDVKASGNYTSKDAVKMTTEFNISASDDRAKELGISAIDIRDQGITERVLQERMAVSREQR